MSDSASGKPSISHKWKEISDLPEELDSMRDRELESLYEVWVRQKESIGDDKRISDFNAELAREWAIETGIIEGVYTLDRGITQTLIERGIDSAYIPHDATNRDPELVARTIQNHAEVLEGLFAFVTGERVLSTGYIKELHSALLRNVDSVVVFDPSGRPFETRLEKGLYKTMPNNPLRPDGAVHEYCPPEHVASEMDRLVQFHHLHTQRAIRPHVAAAWLHHAFTQIHPFQDGNGRVARTLASLVFIKDGFFPLVVNRDDKAKYIDALESADHGDLLPLVHLFSQVQKRALTKAIGRAVDIRPVSSVEEALAATRDMLVDLGRIVPTQFLSAKRFAGVLFALAQQKLAEITSRLNEEIAQVDSTFQFSAGTLSGPPLNEIRSVAEKLKYEPDVSFHEAAVANFKAAGIPSRIVVSFHGVGAAFRGLLVAAAYFQAGDGPAVPISEDVFRISYQDQQNEIAARFHKWLDGCIVEGIAHWRRTLV
ncbi:MAG: Fic family protein [Acidobacteriia bacterium]|nr:Fic family protein [Terriglobia bacterium]